MTLWQKKRKKGLQNLSKQITGVQNTKPKLKYDKLIARKKQSDENDEINNGLNF